MQKVYLCQSSSAQRVWCGCVRESEWVSERAKWQDFLHCSTSTCSYLFSHCGSECRRCFISAFLTNTEKHVCLDLLNTWSTFIPIQERCEQAGHRHRLQKCWLGVLQESPTFQAIQYWCGWETGPDYISVCVGVFFFFSWLWLHQICTYIKRKKHFYQQGISASITGRPLTRYCGRWCGDESITSLCMLSWSYTSAVDFFV